MDVDTDQRRQINRNNRNTRDKLSEKVLNALRGASVNDAQSLLEAIRQDMSPVELESALDRLSLPRDFQQSSSFEPLSIQTSTSPQLRKQNSNTGDWLHTPTDLDASMNLTSSRRPSFIESEKSYLTSDGFQEEVGQSSRATNGESESKLEQMSPVMLSFREMARTQIANGMPAPLILSMIGTDVELLFRDRGPEDPHTVSTWACELAKSATFAQPVCQLATVHFAASFMRWLILPCSKTYAMMSPLLCPVPVAAMVHSNAQVEFCESNAARLIEGLISNNKQLNWPYTYVACLEDASPDMATQPRRLSTFFTDYCDNPASWITSGV
jgi:hypothetical protein